MVGDWTIDPARQTRRQQANGRRARGGERADVYPEHGLPVGVVAEGFAAAQHGEWLFLPVEL